MAFLMFTDSHPILSNFFSGNFREAGSFIRAGFFGFASETPKRIPGERDRGKVSGFRVGYGPYVAVQ